MEVTGTEKQATGTEKQAMSMRIYLLISLANGLIWTGIAMFTGVTWYYLPTVFAISYPFTFFVLMFIGGAGANNQCCDEISHKYFVNKEIE